jgi:hypothetical protein
MLIQSHLTIKPLWLFSLGICFLLGQLPYSHADKSQGIPEYQVKATFLLNFSKFVTYPEESFSDSASEIRICLLGDDPFQGSLDTLVKGEKIRERSIKINYIRDVEKTSECHTLFISASEQKQMVNIIAYLKNKPILTVSDIENFVTRGGMIQFYILDNNIRFFIDPVTISEAKLKVSSRLLQVASVVGKGAK